MADGPNTCPVDERILCANSGQICVARASLLRQANPDAESAYGETLDDESEAFREMSYSSYDDFSDEYESSAEAPGRMFGNSDVALTMKLAEYDFMSKRIGCNGPVNEDCPTRLVMVASKPRARALTVLRRLKLIS
jgi:hypothetical protein